MKKAIIHISDLHICDYLDIKGRRTKSSEKFRLNTSKNESSLALAYIDTFCNKVREKYDEEYQLFLLITGDITDTSSIDENDKVRINFKNYRKTENWQRRCISSSWRSRC
jgi:predicted MPP superfamily phosphohydrolase